MPTPIGHSIASAILNDSKIFVPSQSLWRSILVAVVLGNLADIDFLPGILLGNPNQFHHGISHSLGAALVVGLIFAVYYWLRSHRFFAPFFFATILYASHIVLDSFSVDTRPPFGVPMFWPLSAEYTISPILIFSDVHRHSSTANFLQSLFVTHNARTVLQEIVILGALAGVISVVKNVRGRLRTKRWTVHE